MSQLKGYVDQKYLQAARHLLAPIKQRTYELMRVEPGQRVLDVGCGPGTDTVPLAVRVGAAGRVVGVDTDAAMLAEADRHAAREGVSAWTEHRHADAAALPFDSNLFDACRSERLFQHLQNPEPAMAEMARVTRPGGWVVVLDTDHGTWSTDTPESAVERKLADFRVRRMFHNGFAGRQLRRLFAQHGLAEISIEIVAGYFDNYAFWRLMSVMDRVEAEALAAGVVTADELARWRAGLEQADAAGVFFGSESLTLAAGRKA
nr:methyltransferase domain-containing protein [Chloroflexota bacterium]